MNWPDQPPASSARLQRWPGCVSWPLTGGSVSPLVKRAGWRTYGKFTGRLGGKLFR